MIYTPHLWKIIRINPLDGSAPHKRIIASWYGGFAGSNSWKLSSGNESCVDSGDTWYVSQTSDSKYVLKKGCYGMRSYTSNVLETLRENSKNRVTIDVLDEPTNEKDFL